MRPFYDENADALTDPFAPRRRPMPLRDHAAFSGRWLSASLLLGLVGAGLLTSSLLVSEADSPATRSPEKAIMALPRGTSANGSARKGDLLVQRGFSIGTARHFRAPLTETVGAREITKVHALVHVAAELSPLAIAAPNMPDLESLGSPPSAGREAAPQTATDPADADVSVVRRDLVDQAATGTEPGLSDAAATEQVAELLRLSGSEPQLPLEYSNQRILSRTLRLAVEAESEEASPLGSPAFGSLDVRIIPENVTNIPVRTGSQGPFEERDVMLGHGDTLASILQNNGADDRRVAAIIAALGKRAKAELPEGQHLRILIAPEGSGQTVQRVILFDETGPEEIAAADDSGRFVAVAKNDAHRGPADDSNDDDDEDSGERATLFQSVYASAVKSQVPRELIDEFVGIFASNLDLKQRTNVGDRLEMIFSDDESAPTGRRELLYAALTAEGETHRVYRYASPETGDVDYLDEEGLSLRKLLMRRPVQIGRMSSPFGMRRHPILRYSRLHSGVDWASPRGTPIMAAGDGKVVAAGPHAGYGNRVEIEHANGYATAYNHMANIGSQIKPGAAVRMGEIIGTVGTTGLSTGPHVHYEVTINNHFVDPMKVKLPSNHSLGGAALSEFKDHQRQIEKLRQPGPAATVAVQNGRAG
ncbi:M23 family metallopeptidase [Bosea sp. 2KB_26]|uniref:M23 family metallopeptidase n=1 Tax=Bosea sp. 2KB_26 TaxID=3237475 RepID=UPI003F90445E